MMPGNGFPSAVTCSRPSWVQSTRRQDARRHAHLVRYRQVRRMNSAATLRNSNPVRSHRHRRLRIGDCGSSIGEPGRCTDQRCTERHRFPVVAACRDRSGRTRRALAPSPLTAPSSLPHASISPRLCRQESRAAARRQASAPKGVFQSLRSVRLRTGGAVSCKSKALKRRQSVGRAGTWKCGE